MWKRPGEAVKISLDVRLIGQQLNISPEALERWLGQNGLRPPEAATLSGSSPVLPGQRQ